MKKITATGQSVEAAVESALAQLNSTRDRVEIEIADEGKRGLFGLFGSRQAIVHVTLLADPIEESLHFLKKVSEEMGVQADITVHRQGKAITFLLSGEKIALVIGKRGQTLNALQYLTQLVVNRHAKQYLNVVVDVEGYRERRNETLILLATRMADKAVRTGKAVSLEPMPSYERKVIHTALMNDRKIKTTSHGTEPYRYLVITPIQ
ncbi:RNA-binding cell elongation regulator Jag/EloR [Peribacillus sp. Hz7]|uniref:RNA-binding cell elongation regulator Jag/EloR n=1 Tax=Peribacillus sp. Hz7 TaxID=3344873 RepID=UPI0035CAA09D